MKMNKLIIMGFFSLLFGHKSNAQSNLIDITSKSEKGFHDLVFNIANKQLDKDNNWILTAKGQYKNIVVGFKIVIKNNINPGIVNGKPDQFGMLKNAGQFLNIGSESDNFIKILSELYGFKSDKKFTKNAISFDCFSLNSQKGDLEKADFKFKLFLDSQDSIGLYSELFLNVSLTSGLIELNEKDPEYRENIIKIMTK
jgi:hypothetical protein